MDSEEVLILSVEESAECLCLGKSKTDKGKGAADPGRRRLKKACRESKAPDSCLVIVDGGSDSEDGYIEVYGGKRDKDGMRHVDSAGDDKDILECVSKEELGLLGDHMLHDEPVLITGANGDVTKRPKKTNADSAPNIVDSLLPRNTDGGHHISATPTASEISNNEADTSSVSLNRPLLSCSSGNQIHRTPTCWTNCPNCPPSKKRKYHLIDVAYNCPEWQVVSNPFTEHGFTVNRVQRVQNESLWERLCYEKQLMLRDRQNVNEQLLYHTSCSPIPVICEEGLDVRLSRNGMFGSGIYFSDSPVKCNCYWRGGVSANRFMFCCRVLLGEIKYYPKGKSEQLRREPPRPNPKPGEPKFYDSVMGNLSGQNEFVVYNAYRVMPEYVILYSLNQPAIAVPTIAIPTAPLSHPPFYVQMAMGKASSRKRCKKRGVSRKK